MAGFRRIFLSFVFCFAFVSLGAQAGAQVEPQQVDPIHNFTPSKDPNEVYVAPSATEILQPDARVDVPDNDTEYYLFAPVIVQRVTERSYILLYNVFSSLVYRGNHGLLMVDCGGHSGDVERQRILEALAEIGGWDSPEEVGSGLPLHTLVITHPHMDHCGNSGFFKSKFPNLRIVGSKWLDDEIRINNLPMARPTRVIYRRFGDFFFEGKKFTFNTPVRSAHTGADSYVITPDKVLMAVDIVQASRLPFIEMSVVRDVLGYIHMLRYLAGEAQAGNWTIASWGHFNVGYPRDVTQTLNYLAEMFNNWGPAFIQNPPQNFVDPAETNVAVLLNNWFDAMAEAIFNFVAPNWDNVRFFELGRDHADRVHEVKFLSYLNSNDPNTAFATPDFSPIPPGTRLYWDED